MRIAILCLYLFASVTLLAQERTTIIAENIFRYQISPEGKLVDKREAIEQKTYDLQGKLIRQIFYNDTNSSIIDRNIVFFYDSLKLVSKETYGRENTVEQVERYIYDPTGKLITKKIYKLPIIQMENG